MLLPPDPESAQPGIAPCPHLETAQRKTLSLRPSVLCGRPRSLRLVSCPCGVSQDLSVVDGWALTSLLSGFHHPFSSFSSLCGSPPWALWSPFPSPLLPSWLGGKGTLWGAPVIPTAQPGADGRPRLHPGCLFLPSPLAPGPQASLSPVHPQAFPRPQSPFCLPGHTPRTFLLGPSRPWSCCPRNCGFEGTHVCLPAHPGGTPAGSL